MKGLICQSHLKAGALCPNTGLPPTSANRDMKSSGRPVERDRVILLRLKGKRVSVSKLSRLTAASRGEADIYELILDRGEDNINTEIMIYSPSSVKIEEYGSSRLTTFLRPLIYMLKSIPKKRVAKIMDLTNAE